MDFLLKIVTVMIVVGMITFFVLALFVQSLAL